MSRFTAEQKREILRQARENIAGRTTPRPSTTPRSSATPRTSTPHRSDQSKFKLVHKTYEPKDDDDSPAANGAVAVRAAVPVATASATEQLWWQWVQEHVDYRYNVLLEATGEALGTVTNDLCESLEREDSAIRREIELLRRELAMLREEIKVERGLRELHKEVAKAREQVPKVPAIEARLRAEANIARVDIGAGQAQLKRELEATRRTVAVMRARQSNLDSNLSNLSKFMEGIQTNEIEYESASERMVIRHQIHPDAARALRAFAATVINHDDVVH